MMDFSDAIVVGIPLVLVVLGLVEWIKQLGLQGNADLNASYGGALAMAMDNGTVLSVAAKWYIGGTDQEIAFSSNMGSGAWTASGTKRVRCLAIYAKGT